MCVGATVTAKVKETGKERERKEVKEQENQRTHKQLHSNTASQEGEKRKTEIWIEGKRKKERQRKKDIGRERVILMTFNRSYLLSVQ